MKQGFAGAALVLLLLGCRQEARGNTAATSADAEKQLLHVITGLPLFFAEGFTLVGDKNAALARLEQEFTVVPADGPEQLPPGGLLLAAQPRAMTAERLVELDGWVRSGGRLLLLADPKLEWESELPLGDPGRPPVAFADTGLIQHWGLTLRAPAETGPRGGRIGQAEILTASPGTLSAAGVSCRVEDGGLVARCGVGQGKATVVADADFINVGGAGALDGPTKHNLEALTGELKLLAPR